MKKIDESEKKEVEDQLSELLERTLRLENEIEMIGWRD